MSAISFILPWIVSQAFAGVVEIPVAKTDRLVVKGFEAQIQLIGQPGQPLKINGVESNSTEGVYIVTKKDNVIEVKMNEFSGKKSWMDALPRAAQQLKRIEISGEPIQTDIHIRGGNVTAKNWSRDLKLSMTQGRANLTGGAGALSATVQKGEITVTDHNGTVLTDSYSGVTTLRNIQGDVNTTQFSGQLVAEKVRGVMTVATQQSTSKINQGAGTLQFENGKGAFSVIGFQGRVEGQNQEGPVSVNVPLEGEVDVRSKSGRVSVQLPPGSGASLNLLTQEGEILVPGEVKVVKQTTEKSVRGRLRGDAQKASVFVRSQDGTISVK
jgi:hypothetical protein